MTHCVTTQSEVVLYKITKHMKIKRKENRKVKCIWEIVEDHSVACNIVISRSKLEIKWKF